MAQLAQLTQVKFNGPSRPNAATIGFSPIRDNELRVRRRVYFPFWASLQLPPRVGTFWLDSAGCVNFATREGPAGIFPG